MPDPGSIPSGGSPPPNDRSYWVVDDVLLAGAYPFDWDPDRGRAVLRRLVDVGGVTAFVDLTTTRTDGHLTSYHAHLPDGVSVVRRPIPDMGVPSVAEMAETLDVVDDLIERGETVYVHCWGGLGRTGTVVSCWLLRHGHASRDDVNEVLTGLRRADRGAGHLPAPQVGGQHRFVANWPEGS